MEEETQVSRENRSECMIGEVIRDGGRENVENKPRVRRPRTQSDVESLIRENRGVSLKETDGKLEISVGRSGLQRRIKYIKLL